MPNNTAHRLSTIQRIRLSAGRDGRLVAFASETWSGNLTAGGPEPAAAQTELLYAGTNLPRRRRARPDTLKPPLAGAASFQAKQPDSAVKLTLNCSPRVVAHGLPDAYRMPAYRGQLSDREIADV